MKLIKAPEQYVCRTSERRIFLAGGITGAPMWQDQMSEYLKDTDLVVFNPRREGFDVRQANINKEQIEWEFKNLYRSDAISFWFPYPAQCAITLFELGCWLRPRAHKEIFIGVDPQYVRREDVEIQVGLARPEIKIVSSLEALAEQVTEWENGYK